MKINSRITSLLLPLVCLSMTCTKESKFMPDTELSVAFYNLDNLFDPIDDPGTGDDEFTPNGKYKWTKKRYQQKLNNMEKVISVLANGYCPDILGVCELESGVALKDLLNTGALRQHYQYVHFDSPDERGVDVALAYNSSKIEVIESQAFMVNLSKDSGDRTRDVLWVKCLSKSSLDTLNFIVCHFPSRREGKMESEQNRLDAAKTVKKVISEKVKAQHLVLMGDFNDQPKDKSMSQIIGAEDYNNNPNAALFNLMYEFYKDDVGSYFYRGHWERIDQLIISRSLRDNVGIDYNNKSVKATYFEWLIQKGKYKGYPLRTFGGDKWLNGYSDHLPVYMVLQLNKNGKN
ncbi:MAG TPA: endonuclease/exonuclease/phosphatase family protein [Bacteroidia bacterium]